MYGQRFGEDLRLERGVDGVERHGGSVAREGAAAGDGGPDRANCTRTMRSRSDARARATSER